MRMSGADGLISQLKLEQVEAIFGVPGVQLDDAMDALARLGDTIDYVVNRHEQGSAYMADGYARSTGRPGVCMVVPGPGLLNAMAGLATAYATSSPVLCISGQLHSRAIGKDLGALHEVPHQSRLLDSVTKWHALATAPEEIPALVREAFRQMSTGRPRPVAIEVPPDVLRAEAEIELIEPWPVEQGVDGEVAAAAELLRSAERPVLYAGSGVHLAGASAELQTVAERLGAPVVHSRSGLGALPATHPLACTKLEGDALLAEADVVLAVGTRFLGLGGKALSLPEARVIHLDADPASMIPPRSPEVALVADARAGLAALAEELRTHEACGALAARVPQLREEARRKLDAIEPQMSYLRAIRAAMPDDGVLVSEVTQVAYLVRVGFPFLASRSNITAGYQGTLGFGFPTALGAKYGNPHRAVVSITGDGGFGWGLAELATAVRHRIGLVTVVFDDGRYGNVNRTQREDYGGRVIGTDLHNPDFAALAETFGVRGLRASGPAELEERLGEALAEGGPAVIHVPVGEMPDPWKLLG